MPVKGAREFKKFKEGNPLTRKQAILAQCYVCNGFEGEDCLCVNCPLYRWSPYTKVSSLVVQTLKNPYPGDKEKALPKAKTRESGEKAQKRLERLAGYPITSPHSGESDRPEPNQSRKAKERR